MDQQNIEESASLELSSKDVMQEFIQILQFLLGEKAKNLSHLFSKKVKFKNLVVEYKNLDYLHEITSGNSYLQLSTYFDTLSIVGQSTYFLSLGNASKLVNLYLKKESSNEIKWNTKNMDFLKEVFIYFVSLFNNVLSEKLNQIILTDPLSINLIKHEEPLDLDSMEKKWAYVKYHLVFDEEENSIVINQAIAFSVIRNLISLLRVSQDEEMDYSSSSQDDLGVFGTVITSISPIKYKHLPKVTPLPLESDKDFSNNISLLLDLKMKLTVELGRARMKIDKILGLGEGSIIELNKLAGEPVDLFVNSNLIAKGEVVVIDQNFGVRITEIIGTSKRLERIL